VPPSFEGAQSFGPIGILDDLFPTGRPSIQDNSQEYIDPFLLTIPEHESQNRSQSVISRLVPEALAQGSRSQSLLDSLHPEAQHIPPITYMGILGHNEELQQQQFLGPSSPTSLHLSTFQSASPTSSDQVSSDTQGGKIEIVSTSAKISCLLCQESFQTTLRYRKHLGAFGCKTLFSCYDCGRKFKIEKDLQRHRGHNKAASSCPQRKGIGLGVKPFACTCNSKAYTRKDSLLRHLREHVNDKPQHHRCKACDHHPCRC
jgi:hypothetical protein